MDRRALEGGFSLLEVIVVLALVSVALVPLFQMQSTLSLSTRRALDQTRISQALHTTLNHFESLNISQTPSGQLNLEDTTVEWTSTVLQSHIRPSGLFEQGAARNVNLHRVRLIIKDSTGRVIFSDDINLVGWTVPVS